MKQKIEWYREVLELEPGSRVFFPLAKLLAADGQTTEAVAALRHGLLRHPDHVEARLLLVELLSLQQQDGELATELEDLAGLFASYPGFWKAWSERLAANPALHDAALAMRFFAAALQGQHINWAEVIEQGLAALLGQAAGLGQPLAFAPAPSPEEAAPVAAPDATEELVPAAPDPVASLEDFAPHAPQIGDAGEEEDAEEDFSLRTRSMAEVLAEQGDLAGALEIYHELMQNAGSEEKASLEARAAELVQRQQSGHGDGPVEDKPQVPGGESTRLVSLLESLAQRLEARAR